MPSWVSLSGVTGRPYLYSPYDRFGDWLELPANYAFAYLGGGLVPRWIIVYLGEAENIK
jgi:hypothetical protein